MADEDEILRCAKNDRVRPAVLTPKPAIVRGYKQDWRTKKK